MHITKNLVTSLILSFLLAGCAAEVIAYHPRAKMSVKEASATLVDLNNKMERSHPVEITDEFIQYVQNGDQRRFYFKSIEKVTIYDNKGWVKVYVSGSDISDYVYIAPHLDLAENTKDAELYVDALESLVSAYKDRHKDLTKPEIAPTSSVQRMQNLQTLKDKGLITDSEYRQKRKQILDDL